MLASRSIRLCQKAGYCLDPGTPGKNLLQSKLRLDLLTELTFKDQLTALYNRYYLFTEIPTQLKRLSRESKSLGVIMIDINY